VFLPSQQGRLRGDDGHDASASSLTSARTAGSPVVRPDCFQLGPAWILFHGDRAGRADTGKSGATDTSSFR